jgi:hypothetical protein
MNSSVKVDRCDLTAEMVRERLDYNPSTGVLTWKALLCNRYAGKVAGSLHRRTGYVAVNIHHRTYPAHSLAWLYVHGELPALLDHIDGNRANNALANLRVATALQNQLNRPSRGYYRTRCNKFAAAIRVAGERISLGNFDTPEEAHAAYSSAHAMYHGEYSFTARPATADPADPVAVSIQRRPHRHAEPDADHGQREHSHDCNCQPFHGAS